MEAFTAAAVSWLLATLSLPSVGLPAIFIVALISATLLPLGSEPVVYGYVSLTQSFWPAVFVATVGNTLGGMITYGMGLGAFRIVHTWRESHPPAVEQAELPPGGQKQAAAPSDSEDHAPVQERRAGGRWHEFSELWLNRLGPAALIFSWLPIVGDPLCAVAGYLRFAFWPSVFFMALGKFLRYVTMTAALLWALPLFT